MQARLDALTATAVEQPQPWTVDLNEDDPDARLRVIRAVVAYRDRWGINTSSALGAIPNDDAQRSDYERARIHLHAASRDAVALEEECRPAATRESRTL
ncbi:MAG: hypothetical protein B5766_06440 [Candidatus Lumbricidophila eiseniae]|uniref:Uncharacterized protein n=1 Tax=Candidatus Lumbricidiphila eiseniae TaxID=1969409 RepID=A0A2A6FRQ4_9MICO|nr:MAG: hypothetical protein B5766_06440 [Candidatus Lumbricidophila eiseniae]